MQASSIISFHLMYLRAFFSVTYPYPACTLGLRSHTFTFNTLSWALLQQVQQWQFATQKFNPDTLAHIFLF